MLKQTVKKIKYIAGVFILTGMLCLGSNMVWAEDSILGKWCVTGKHAEETIEFLDDETMILTSGGAKQKGSYMVNEEEQYIYYALENASDTQNGGGVLYYKTSGDHLALLASDEEMELSIITAYYTREESQEKYNTEDEITGLARRAWTVRSGAPVIMIDGEEYASDELYFVFGMNLLQIGKPQTMGDGYYTKMLYAPYEYSEDCTKITFFFNDPFEEKTNGTYEIELSENELKFVNEEGTEIIFDAVEVKSE